MTKSKSTRVQFRLSNELYSYVKRRASDSKIEISEYMRLLIVLDVDRDKGIGKSLALEEVTKQMAELQKSMRNLESLRDQLIKTDSNNE